MTAIIKAAARAIEDVISLSNSELVEVSEAAVAAVTPLIRAAALAEAIRETAATKELPDNLRDPLHSLQADLDWLLARIVTEPDFVPLARDSIANRLSQIETAAYQLANLDSEAVAPLRSSHDT